MKWLNWSHHFKHLEELKVQRGDELEMYYPHVIQIASTFSRESVAIGALNFQDLYQAGYAGLIEAWHNLDHDRDQPEKWAFLKKRIKGSIRREIDMHGSFIKIPRRQLEEHRKNLTAIDKELVNIFPRFFDNTVMSDDHIKSWDSMRLLDIIDDYLFEHVKNVDHRDILKLTFGIDTIDEKPKSLKDIALQFKTTESNIQNIKHRAIKKLNTEEFENIIENFYQNV